MKLYEFDFKRYVEKNKAYYFIFFSSFVIGVIIGLIITFSNSNYFNLLTPFDNNLVNVISGNASGVSFWNRLFLYAVPLFIIFIFSLNFFSGIFGYILLSYQTVLLVLSISSIIKLFGISGILSSIFLILPINLCYLLVLGIFLTNCQKRAYYARKYGSFDYGLKELDFWLICLICLATIVLLSLVITFVIPIIIRNSIFIIF